MRRDATQGPRARVLLAAPDARLRLLARESLGQQGFEVVEAADGASVLAALEARRPHLALLDARLPDTDGIALCEKIRQQPHGAQLPILLVLPADEALDLRRAFEAGATEVVQRPLHWRILVHRVQRMLDAVRSHAELFRTRGQLAGLQRIARLATWDYEVESGRLHSSREIRAIFGLGAEDGPVTLELLATRLRPEEQESLRLRAEQALRDRRGLDLDARIRLPNGAERVLHAQAEVVLDEAGRPIRVAGTVQDITERKQAEDQIRFLAYHDSLTGLSNRHSFMERLRQVLGQARRHERTAAILFLDLDRFKRINDTLGHSVGDLLLQHVADRLVQTLRDTDYVTRAEPRHGDSVSRLGGDEFTVLLSEISSADDAARVAARIIEILREPFIVEGQELIVGTSIGITVFPHDGEDVETLLRNADAAMYHAKEQGRNNYQFFTTSMNAAANTRLTMERKLRKALKEGRLQLHYQPQVDVRTGAVTGVEALLRWHDPELGMVSPAEFVPLAEEAGLVVPIGEWVLRTVCGQCRAWQEAGLPPLRVAVNISPHHFKTSRLVETLSQTLWDSGISADLLELEVTETALMQGDEPVVEVLREVKRMGVSVALDDFGTGYSSLSYLKRFPVDAVKIDRSFVRDIAVDPDDAALTAAIVSIAKTLRLRVIAEGVETPEQREFLRARGCDEMQGFLMSPPLPPEELLALLRSTDTLPRA